MRECDDGINEYYPVNQLKLKKALTSHMNYIFFVTLSVCCYIMFSDSDPSMQNYNKKQTSFAKCYSKHVKGKTRSNRLKPSIYGSMEIK
jgi:hypothetical protein